MAALKLRRVINNRHLQRRYGTPRGICGEQLIQVFVRELPFSLVSTTASSTDPLTLRRLMSYIYMEHPFLMFLDHTQRRSTVGRTPLDE